MDIKVLIPTLALVTQLISVYFSIRLMRYAEKRVVASVFILVVCLMAFRRMISLVRSIFQGVIQVDVFAESVALVISLLILYGIIAIARIIKSEEESKRAAASAETRYRTLFDQSPYGVLLINANGDIVDFNETANQQLGYERDEFSKLRISDINPVESPADNKARFEKVMKDGKDEFEIQHKTKRGDIRDVFVIIQSIELSGQTFFHAIWRDITQFKQAEEQIKRALTEKEVLLKEIHHRVKNNMQVIYSLLNLQATGIEDKAVRAMFEDARNRVKSIALIHEKLYQSRDLAHINFKEYLKNLIQGIAETYKRHDIIFSVDMEPVSLDVNVGIPCGLIVNELVSNSLKHAFPDGRKGTIKVAININSKGNNVLTVADNGVGFPENADFRNTTSLGLQLVNVLSAQIQGTVKLTQTEGTEFSITFPGTTENRL